MDHKILEGSLVHYLLLAYLSHPKNIIHEYIALFTQSDQGLPQVNLKTGLVFQLETKLVFD